MTRRLLVLAATLVPAMAGAHPLGNVSTNRWVSLEPAPGRLDVHYVVDFAELPAYRELQALDTDADGRGDAGELAAWATAQARALAELIDTRVDGGRVALLLERAGATLTPGTAGLPTLRLEVDWHAPLPAHAAVAFRDGNFAGRPGWREVIARGAGAAVADASVPQDDVTRALRAYPADRLAEPLAVSAATFRVEPATGRTAPAAGTAPEAAAPAARPAADASTAGTLAARLAAVVADPAPLALGGLIAALALAMLLGALHALGPGHGKTIVGAWLVGTRGTPRHAVMLGGIVTATHTAGVFALGVAALAASRWVLPERLMPWLSVASGLLVVAVGCSLAARRLAGGAHHHTHDGHPDHAHPHHHAHAHGHPHHHAQDHEHGHSHLPPADAPVGLRSLVALGISGGLVPCPSALVLMLGAIALGRTALGLGLVLAFSAGLATVLTIIGLVLVRARHLFDRFPTDGRLVRFAPVASAVIISLAGLAIVAQALVRIGA